MYALANYLWPTKEDIRPFVTTRVEREKVDTGFSLKGIKHKNYITENGKTYRLSEEKIIKVLNCRPLKCERTYDKVRWDSAWKDSLSTHPNDLRYELLQSLRNRLKSKIKAISPLQPASSYNELFPSELIEKAEYFLRAEKYFQMTKDFREKFLDQLHAYALKRNFFVPSIEPYDKTTSSPKTASTQDVLEMEVFDRLCRDPEFRPTFKKFFDAFGNRDVSLTLFLAITYNLIDLTPAHKDKRDVRDTLLDQLQSRTVRKIWVKTAIRLTHASSYRELILIELVKKIEFFLKAEKHFSFLDQDFRERYSDFLREQALKRRFLPQYDEDPCNRIVPKRASSEDVILVQSLDFLNCFPRLLSKFQKLYEKIGGLEELKLALFLDVIVPISMPDHAKEYNVFPPNGLLFYGPPGCGKTFISKTLAEVLGVPIVEYSAGTHRSPYIHQSSIGIQKVFDEAKQKKPSIIFIDEASSVFPRRDFLDSSSSYKEEEVSQFLKLMEGAGREGILVVCATNFPDRIDPAVLRSGRLDRKFYLPPPDNTTRKEMFQNGLKGIKKTDPSIDFDNLARATEYFVSSDIKLVIENAARCAMRERMNVNENILMEQIRKTRPSLTIEELKKFEQMKWEKEKN